MKSAMHPEAREEFLAAIDYYNDAEPGLGMAFYSEIEDAIALVDRYPDLWIGIGGGIRRCGNVRVPKRTAGHAHVLRPAPQHLLVRSVGACRI